MSPRFVPSYMIHTPKQGEGRNAAKQLRKAAKVHAKRNNREVKRMLREVREDGKDKPQ